MVSAAMPPVRRTMQVDTDAIDGIAAGWFAARASQPGLAYGVVADGELVHAGGLGERRAGGPPPDADTVFRIASMTKSFTAALVLLLRDAGALALDDPAVDYVPEVAGVVLPTRDCPPLAIRHLLTMTAGFTTDDPWGDRQQGLDPAEFSRLLADGGVRCGWAPGTRFEYSNLGYALLGNVIESVTGQDYAQAVRERLLTPLQLERTGYEVDDVDPARLARGYRRDSAGAGWLELQPDPYGAFAPMGGVLSCVRDLARWVAGFATAFPARDLALPADTDAGHPLCRASRREMQLAQSTIPVGGDGAVIHCAGPPRISYGFGLFCEDDPAFGDIVQHSGGYPGYGSHMRWHPATGLGVIVLANGTYAPAGSLAGELLAALLASSAAAAAASPWRVTGPVPAPVGPWPETLAARDAVDGLLQNWDDDVAGRLLAPNVDLDEPLTERRADIETIRERIGPFRRNDGRPAECDSPAHCRWWLTGPGGTVAVQIRLAPLREPLVQQLTVAIPSAAGSPLARTLASLIASLDADRPEWPDGVTVAGGLRIDEVLRQLRMARAWAGDCTLDSYLAGNGHTSAAVRLTGATGRVELELEVSEPGHLVRAGITLAG
jgi:CubicO group peptidase (beta-lactamase class C family)